MSGDAIDAASAAAAAAATTADLSPSPSAASSSSSSGSSVEAAGPEPLLFASRDSSDSGIVLVAAEEEDAGPHAHGGDGLLLSSSPPDDVMNHLPATLLATAAASLTLPRGDGSDAGGAAPVVGVAGAGNKGDASGEVLRKVIGDLKELETEAASSAVRAGIADQRRQLTQLLRAKVQRRIRKTITGDETKRVRDHIREPPVARRIDKAAFTFGVLNLTLTEFVLVRFPQFMAWWYLTVVPVLVFFRIPHYRSLKWEFFLLDFCYYVQVLCLLQLYAFPESCALLKSNFLLATGPLAWAVPVWRNSLVFHDVEKITSLYIHIFPGLLLYALRWYPRTPAAAAVLDRCGGMGSGDLATASLVYLAWQALYYLKIEVLDRAKLDADPELQTSLRWLAKDTKNPLHKLVLKLTRATGVLAKDEVFDHRQGKTKFIFILTQFVYTLLTCLPPLLVYGSFSWHVAYGLFMFVIAVHNGAGYYIDVFSVRYASKYPHERPCGLGPGRKRPPPPTQQPPAAPSEDGGHNKPKEA